MVRVVRFRAITTTAMSQHRSATVYLEDPSLGGRVLLYRVGDVGALVEDWGQIVDVPDVDDHPGGRLVKAVRSDHRQLVLYGPGWRMEKMQAT